MGEAPLVSEVTRPERRRFILVLGLVNLVFMGVDLAHGQVSAAPGALWSGRALLTFVLLGLPLLLSRVGSPVQVRLLVLAAAVLAAAGFAALSLGHGGAAGAYFFFLPMLPLVLVIAVPDEPVAAGACWATVVVLGLSIVLQADPAPSVLAFWLMALCSPGGYATVGAGLYRRMRQREHAMALERAQAHEALAALERRRGQDERLALIGRLTAGVAHEILTPVTYVDANLGWLGERLQSEPHLAGRAEMEKDLADARQGVERIARIASDLRGFARGASDALEPCEVPRLVDEALRLASVRLKGLTLPEVRVPPGLPTVVASPTRLVQVLVNLLVNAADALEVQRRARGGRGLRLLVEAGAEPTGVWLAVEDNGPGLPEATLGHLFEPFFTTKGEAGTGLGLALSREYVQGWGGSLEARRVESGGARFVVRLPAAPSAAPLRTAAGA